MKNPYRASNRCTATAQIMNSEVMRLRLESLAPILGKRKSYDTCMVEAQRTGEWVMTHESWRLLVPHNRREAPYIVPLTLDAVRDQEFITALSSDIPFLRNALNNAPACMGRTIDTIHVHKGMAMPAAIDASFGRLPHHVRGAPMFYGRPWFSNIAIVGEDDDEETVELYAKLLILFQVRKRRLLVPYAFIKYYDIAGEKDGATGCKELQWAATGERYVVIAVTSILRAVELVRTAPDEDVWLVNRYMF
ncbi:unnamed protein product [Closterium sp. NIES-54]